MTLSDKKEQREPEASKEVETSPVQEEELCVKDEEPAPAQRRQEKIVPCQLPLMRFSSFILRP